MKPISSIPSGPAGGLADRKPERDPLGLYASAIDTSDYVARVAPLIRQLVPDTGDLIDIGAGAGQLGGALVDRGRRWTAIEPAPVMQARLQALPNPPALIPLGWDDPGLVCAPAATVLAATMPGYLADPAAFLAFCRSLARHAIIWVVPAQRGPRGLILAGCLPSAWHGEDETPAIDLILPQLRGDRPSVLAETDWTFSLVTRDLPGLGRYLADRLGWLPDDPRRADLIADLASQAETVPGGLCLSVHRRSAILVWNLS
ncbi:hypothetical protein [Bosea sp. (in: a-proteobacteria)]|uniref:hypothetical protein n=1 Tax=Bosea sp. (in: a-proteobacteria) TaxID=1871050 RepID=UPI0027332D41|nr:hypothetical protein [Bosea sp. (in: a-proteobacteria)]MDP3410391.1 hypothetical protein [Bosea sp. (in: a-proteobacteria)]